MPTSTIAATPEIQQPAAPVAPVTDNAQAWQNKTDASLNPPADTPRVDPNDANAQAKVHVVTDASQIPGGQQPAVVIDTNEHTTTEAANLKGDEKDLYVLVKGDTSSQAAQDAINAEASKLADLSQGKAAIDDQANVLTEATKAKFGKGGGGDTDNGGDGKDGGNDGNDGNGGGGGGGGGGGCDGNNDKDDGKDGGGDSDTNDNKNPNGDQTAQQKALEAARNLGKMVVGDHSLHPSIPGGFMSAHMGSPVANFLAHMHKPPTEEELAQLQALIKEQGDQLGKEGADATKNGDTANGDALTQMGKLFTDSSALDSKSDAFKNFATSLQGFQEAQSTNTLRQDQVQSLMPTQLQEAIATAAVAQRAKEQNIDLSKPSDDAAYQAKIRSLKAGLQMSEVSVK
ncbi:MAG TPA: hypothetical protein V6C69_10230 [Trichormus sp.]